VRAIADFDGRLRLPLLGRTDCGNMPKPVARTEGGAAVESVMRLLRTTLWFLHDPWYQDKITQIFARWDGRQRCH